MSHTVKKTKGGVKSTKKKKRAASPVGATKIYKENLSKESFDSLINQYLVNYLFSEDAMAPTVPANPNAPAKPAEQKKIQDAKKKKAMQLAKPGMVTQAQADAYELGKSEKL